MVGVLWWRHVRWNAALPYVAGSLAGLAAWSLVRYVPGKPAAVLMLGVTPFLVRLLPTGLKPDPERLGQGLVYGSASMTLLLLTGVSGPLMDTFLLGGRLDRREIVATKAVCQVWGHGAKVACFGAIVDGSASIDPLLGVVAVGSSVLGTSLARRLLEAMTDMQFRSWANRLITTVACRYLLQGAWLLARP